MNTDGKMKKGADLAAPSFTEHCLLNTAYCSSGLAKIILPAAVCKTLVTMTDSVLQFQEIEHEDSDDNTSPTGIDIPPLYLALFIVLVITIAVAVMAATLSGRRRRQLSNNPPDSNTDPWPGQESSQAPEQWDWPDPNFQYSDHPTDWDEWKGKR